MTTQKQRTAAKRNVRKAQAGARKKQTLKNLPKRTKTALGKEANKGSQGAGEDARSAQPRSGAPRDPWPLEDGQGPAPSRDQAAGRKGRLT